MRAKRKTSESQQNEGAQMSSELESDRATMVLNLELREPMVLPVISMRLRTSAKFRVYKPAVKIILQVTQICTFAASEI